MKEKLKAFLINMLQFSKLIIIISALVFVGTLIYCITRDLSSLYDSSLYVGAITITGGVFGSAIVWYEKKSQAENVAKIQLQHIKDLAEIELDIYQRKVKFQKSIGVYGKPDVPMDVENMTHVDEAMESMIASSLTKLDTAMDEATSSDEMQAYG